MAKHPLQNLQEEAQIVFDRGDMTLEAFEDLLKRAYQHCKAYPSALAGFYKFAPREWVQRIQAPELVA